MRLLGKLAMTAILGVGQLSAASARDISPFSLLFDPGHEPSATSEATRPRGDTDGFRSGRSAFVPNRNSIGQGVGRD